MDCVNHSGVSATAFCQNCGKALCAGCVRNAAGGQLLCEPCWLAWQSYQQPFAAPPASGPNPAAAAVLGLIPGVGAMYNGQFFKGFIHVIVFAVLISITSSVNGIFGIFIAAWIFYQSFEAFHTAKALRDGQPVPDPFGLNEVGNWLNLGQRPQNPGQPGAVPTPAASTNQPPYAAQAPGPYAPGPYQAPFVPPPAGFPDPNAPLPVYWRRREPIGAIVLIALGLLFLLAQLDVFHGQLLKFTWPLVLIALGVWLFVRRIGDSQGGPK
jgi:TM2 domain-containing membrane protein YozV